MEAGCQRISKYENKREAIMAVLVDWFYYSTYCTRYQVLVHCSFCSTSIPVYLPGIRDRLAIQERILATSRDLPLLQIDTAAKN